MSKAAYLVAARLTHLKLIHLRLSSAEVTRITLAADRLHLLDLSHSAELDSTSCRDLGLLMQRLPAQQLTLLVVAELEALLRDTLLTEPVAEPLPNEPRLRPTRTLGPQRRRTASTAYRLHTQL